MTINGDEYTTVTTHYKEPTQPVIAGRAEKPREPTMNTGAYVAVCIAATIIILGWIAGGVYLVSTDHPFFAIVCFVCGGSVAVKSSKGES